MAGLTVHPHSGYIRLEGLYRVPDLLNEEQFIEYMKNTYDVDVVFVREQVTEEPELDLELDLDLDLE